MNIKHVCAAAALALATGGAFADDQTVTFDGLVASFDSVGTVLDGGDDVITFDGLAAGTYDFVLTMSGQYFNLTGADLNGTTGIITDLGKIIFVGIVGTGSPDFELTLTGTIDGDLPVYSGELTVSAVPEPETYALMLAGLAAAGFMARRRQG